MDSGMKRRVKANENKSEFTEDEKLVDHSKHIYLKDTLLLKNLSDKTLNAFVDILLSYCIEWMKTRKIIYSPSMLDAEQLITGCNDYVKDFMDANIIKTDNINDKIGKNIMRERFLNCYPQLHYNEKQLITKFRDNKINYDKGARPDKKDDKPGEQQESKIQGSYINVRWRTKQDDKDDDKKEGLLVEEVEEDKIIELSINQLDEYNKMKSQLEELQKKLNIYESQNNNISDDDMNLFYNSNKNKCIDKFNLLFNNSIEKQNNKLDDVLNDFKNKHPKKQSKKQPFKINPIKKDKKLDEEFIKVIYNPSENIDDEQHKINIDNFLNQNFIQTIKQNIFDI